MPRPITAAMLRSSLAAQERHIWTYIQVYAMASPITTIRVHKETADRLAAIKIPGLSNEDVINFALDNVPPEKLRELYSEWQKQALEKLFSDPRITQANPEARPPNPTAW